MKFDEAFSERCLDEGIRLKTIESLVEYLSSQGDLACVALEGILPGEQLSVSATLTSPVGGNDQLAADYFREICQRGRYFNFHNPHYEEGSRPALVAEVEVGGIRRVMGEDGRYGYPPKVRPKYMPIRIFLPGD